MGKIIYGQACEIEIDDYALAHVKVVMLSKLRLGQSFPFSWVHENRDGRSTVWVDAAIPLEFRFNTDVRPEPNRQWLDSLLRAANSTDGLRVVPEP